MPCQDCTCQPPFPPGCDCDPAAAEADSTCAADATCVQCVCLPRGCDCDPAAADPDSFCPAGETCQVSRETRDTCVASAGHVTRVMTAALRRTARASGRCPPAASVTRRLTTLTTSAQRTSGATLTVGDLKWFKI